jgi:hypothetical protein
MSSNVIGLYWALLPVIVVIALALAAWMSLRNKRNA